MKGKICIVTGANSGIGLETARGLAASAATVVMLCRSAERGAAAQRQIRQSTGNDEVHLILADLSSLQAIRGAADAFLWRFDRLDVLVNNAGVYRSRRTETVDGYESTFAINHLAYFLLTHLLLDRLKTSAPARIVNVSSNAHRMGRLNFDDLQSTERYAGYSAYARSKLANVLFTNELARRLEGAGVTANSLTPGPVSTNIAGQDGGTFKFFFDLFRPFFLEPARGAATSLYLATSPDVATTSGKYFVKCAVSRPSAAALDPESARRLWEISEKLTGIS